MSILNPFSDFNFLILGEKLDTYIYTEYTLCPNRSRFKISLAIDYLIM